MKQSRRQSSAGQRLFERKSSTLLVGALVVAMLAGLVLLVWQKTSQRVDTFDYDGIVIDRWGDYAETNEGSRPRFGLLIETQDGKRFTVRVDPAVYESAKAGMRIKSRSGQIALIDSEQRTPGNK
ncbi:MAG: hypothetical protein ACREA9_17215 [Pyrinomonadaceae bacterium]